MSEPFVLVPPSEGKATGGRRRFRAGSGTFRRLAAARADVIERLAAEIEAGTDATRAKTLGVRGELLERAVVATAAIAAGTAPVLPARARYTGVVWDHLGAATITDDQAARLLVPSALLGMTTGNDPVPDYRLKFSVGVTGCGRLDRYWREPLTDAVARHTAGAIVVDLLPNEHAAAIDWSRLGTACSLRRVCFIGADGRSAAGHAAKAAKGVLARAVLDRGPSALDRWSWNGWRVTSPRSAEVVTVAAPAPGS